MVLDFVSETIGFFAEISNLPLMGYTFLNNTLFSYIVALMIFLVSLAVLRFFKHVIIRYLKTLCGKTKSDIDDMFIEATQKVFRPLFYITVSLYIALGSLFIPQNFQTYLYYFLMIVGTFYGIKFVSTLVDYGTRKYLEGTKSERDENKMNLMSNLAKAFLWLVAVLLILSNLGYDITTLVAGLGVGGIAIAFALQNILSDVFASFSIYFDKPFKVGDFIIIGDDLGVVKKIGIQSTRLTTLEGDELVLSNKQMIETRVHNYKKMRKRRVAFEVKVDPKTSVKKLKKIPKIMERIISKLGKVKFDRSHFKKFGDFGIVFETVYYIDSSDYNVYMDIQQDINLKTKQTFEKEGIKIAYPMQKLFLK